MEYNLPTGVGFLAMMSKNSLILVKEAFNEEPLDGGAGKIKELDSQIFDKMRILGIRPNWRNMEADWVITANSIYYINPNLGKAGCYHFPFSEWGLVFGRNRAYGLGKKFASLKIINRQDSNLSYNLKTSNSAQLNISYIFNKFEN